MKRRLVAPRTWLFLLFIAWGVFANLPLSLPLFPGPQRFLANDESSPTALSFSPLPFHRTLLSTSELISPGMQTLHAMREEVFPHLSRCFLFASVTVGWSTGFVSGPDLLSMSTVSMATYHTEVKFALHYRCVESSFFALIGGTRGIRPHPWCIECREFRIHRLRTHSSTLCTFLRGTSILPH